MSQRVEGLWEGSNPQCLACRLCRNTSGLHCSWEVQPKGSARPRSETGAWLHKNTSAFTWGQSRREETSVLTSGSYQQHSWRKMDMDFKANVQSTGPFLPVEGLPHQAAEQSLFSLWLTPLTWQFLLNSGRASVQTWRVLLTLQSHWGEV